MNHKHAALQSFSLSMGVLVMILHSVKHHPLYADTSTCSSIQLQFLILRLYLFYCAFSLYSIQILHLTQFLTCESFAQLASSVPVSTSLDCSSLLTSLFVNEISAGKSMSGSHSVPKPLPQIVISESASSFHLLSSISFPSIPFIVSSIAFNSLQLPEIFALKRFVSSLMLEEFTPSSQTFSYLQFLATFRASILQCPSLTLPTIG